MLCPPELRKRYHDGRVIPFLGAGCSMSVEWTDAAQKPLRGPSWAELVEQACSILGFQDADLARIRGTDLQILEYFKRKHGQQMAKLTNWLTKLMDPPEQALLASPIHRALAALNLCRVFYTTNFDNFLERSFLLHNRRCQVIALESHMGRTPESCEIVKFHGDLDHPNQIVLTESDYERRLSLSTAMDHRLRSDLLGRVILFLGYSFRDANVSYLFRLFTDHFVNAPEALPGQRAFITVPDPSDFESELFSARSIQVIPIDGTNMTNDIVALLDEMRS